MTRINLAPPGQYRKTSYAAFIEGRWVFSNRAFAGVKNIVIPSPQVLMGDRSLEHRLDAPPIPPEMKTPKVGMVYRSKVLDWKKWENP